MAIYCDSGIFCLSITGTESFQYRPLLALIHEPGIKTIQFYMKFLINYEELLWIS